MRNKRFIKVASVALAIMLCATSLCTIPAYAVDVPNLSVTADTSIFNSSTPLRVFYGDTSDLHLVLAFDLEDGKLDEYDDWYTVTPVLHDDFMLLYDGLTPSDIEGYDNLVAKIKTWNAAHKNEARMWAYFLEGGKTSQPYICITCTDDYYVNSADSVFSDSSIEALGPYKDLRVLPVYEENFNDTCYVEPYNRLFVPSVAVAEFARDLYNKYMDKLKQQGYCSYCFDSMSPGDSGSIRSWMLFARSYVNFALTDGDLAKCIAQALERAYQETITRLSNEYIRKLIDTCVNATLPVYDRNKELFAEYGITQDLFKAYIADAFEESVLREYNDDYDKQLEELTSNFDGYVASLKNGSFTDDDVLSKLEGYMPKTVCDLADVLDMQNGYPNTDTYGAWGDDSLTYYSGRVLLKYDYYSYNKAPDEVLKHPEEYTIIYYYPDKPEYSYINVNLSSPRESINIHNILENRRITKNIPDSAFTFSSGSDDDERSEPFEADCRIAVSAISNFSIQAFNDYVKAVEAGNYVDFPFTVDWDKNASTLNEWDKKTAEYAAKRKEAEQHILDNPHEITDAYESDSDAIYVEHNAYTERIFAFSNCIEFEVYSKSDEHILKTPEDIRDGLVLISKDIFNIMDTSDAKIEERNFKFTVEVPYSLLGTTEDEIEAWGKSLTVDNVTEAPVGFDVDAYNAYYDALLDCRKPTHDGILFETELENVTLYPDDGYMIYSPYGFEAYRMPIELKCMAEDWYVVDDSGTPSLTMDLTKDIFFSGPDGKTIHPDVYASDGSTASIMYNDGMFWLQFKDFVPGTYTIATNSGHTLTESSFSANIVGSLKFELKSPDSSEPEVVQTAPIGAVATDTDLVVPKESTTTAVSTVSDFYLVEDEETTSAVTTVAAPSTTKTGTTSKATKWEDAPKTVEMPIDDLVAVGSVLVAITFGTAGVIFIIKKRK